MWKALIIPALSGLLVLGACDTGPADPAAWTTPDTSGDDGGNGGLWRLEGPVTYQDGVLNAHNPSNAPGDTATARATLARPEDFGETPIVTFTWREDRTESAQYSFLVGEEVDHMMSVPYHEVSPSSMKAQVQFWLDFRGLLYSRFEFKLPPGAHVRIIGYRAVAGGG